MVRSRAQCESKSFYEETPKKSTGRYIVVVVQPWRAASDHCTTGRVVKGDLIQVKHASSFVSNLLTNLGGTSLNHTNAHLSLSGQALIQDI